MENSQQQFPTTTRNVKFISVQNAIKSIFAKYSHYQSIDDRQEYDQSIGRASIEHRQQQKTSYVLKGRSPIEITFIFYNVNIMLHYVMIS
ncbi:hypothetical protein BLOT_010394 [Blomia tropicalis]|nr:hypothetical protein BLOT_010394 [Blomia tropicalis]